MWLLGLGLVIAGLFVLVIGGFLFFTLILIPLAIIAAIIGVVLLVIGFLAFLVRGIFHVGHHNHDYHHQHSTNVKYCTRCGAPNPKASLYCSNCGQRFLEEPQTVS
jgi:ribosomal protein L40E